MKSVIAGIKITLIILFILPLYASGQQLQDYFPVDSIGVGDTFPLSIVLKKDQSYDKIVYPDSSQISGDFEIKNSRRYRVTDFTDSLVYEIQYFGLSDTTFPSLPVHLINDTDTLTLHTRQAPLYFNSALAEEDSDFLPLKPIYQFARNWWIWIAGFVLLLVLAWLGSRYYRKWREKQKKRYKPVFEPEPFIDPLDELQKELIRLRNDPSLTEQADMKAFYTKLTDALRVYYERLYKIHAMESTTSEMMRDLRSLGLSNDVLQQIHSLLKEADMVKFARFPVTEDHAYEALDRAKTLYEQIREEDSHLVEQLRIEHEEEQQRLKEEFEGRDTENDTSEIKEEVEQTKAEENNKEAEQTEKAEYQNNVKPAN